MPNQRYINQLIETSRGSQGWNVSRSPKRLKPLNNKRLKIKAIAFYLPQFHPIPENDEWWGEGFTEWTNVTKAIPQFVGHYQPHLPGELGFYDLRVVDTLAKQAILARHYGIYGFCFHHYWFTGKRLLEQPLQLLRNSPDIDINYCLCWANENWTRKWDGLDDDILVDQRYSPVDDINFIESIFDYFEDPRYIRIGGCPVLIVYNINRIPDPASTAQRWRERAEEAGFGGLHLIAALSFDVEEVEKYGFDACVEFPPHKVDAVDITDTVEPVITPYSGRIYDYPRSVRSMYEYRPHQGIHYKTVMPSWDNEARRPGAGHSYINARPDYYADWLRVACSQTLSHQETHPLVFINAWNEWAEGAHLEPDRKNGYSYLNATASTLENISYVKSIPESNCKNFVPKSDTCICVHLYYPELSREVHRHLQAIPETDLHLTLPFDSDGEVLKFWDSTGINYSYTLVENNGRDIRPFLNAFCSAIEPFGYSYFCKIHTKMSPHRNDGNSWRLQLFESLLSSSTSLDRLRCNPSVGIICPEESLLNLSDPVLRLGNMYWLEILLKELHMTKYLTSFDIPFVAGSMFWGRTQAFQAIHKLDHLYNSFEYEYGQMDGTLAHAFERILLLISLESGYTMDTIEVKHFHDTISPGRPPTFLDQV
jgi:lipopolysaccharide biosynthesis protein